MLTMKQAFRQESRGKILWQLFIHNFKISAFTFGGGYVIVSLMQKEYVDKMHWIDEKEMMDMVSIVQASPGALAVNASVMIGWKLAGLAGMLISVLATILPCMIILSVISIFYQMFITNPWVALALKGMQAGVAALIVDVSISMSTKVLKKKSVWADLLLFAAFAGSFLLNINVIWIILGGLALGIGSVLLEYAADQKGDRQ